MALTGRKVMFRHLRKKGSFCLKKLLLYQRDRCNGVLLLHVCLLFLLLL